MQEFLAPLSDAHSTDTLCSFILMPVLSAAHGMLVSSNVVELSNIFTYRGKNGVYKTKNNYMKFSKNQLKYHILKKF